MFRNDDLDMQTKNNKNFCLWLQVSINNEDTNTQLQTTTPVEMTVQTSLQGGRSKHTSLTRQSVNINNHRALPPTPNQSVNPFGQENPQASDKRGKEATRRLADQQHTTPPSLMSPEVQNEENDYRSCTMRLEGMEGDSTMEGEQGEEGPCSPLLGIPLQDQQGEMSCKSLISSEDSLLSLKTSNCGDITYAPTSVLTGLLEGRVRDSGDGMSTNGSAGNVGETECVIGVSVCSEGQGVGSTYSSDDTSSGDYSAACLRTSRGSSHGQGDIQPPILLTEAPIAEGKPSGAVEVRVHSEGQGEEPLILPPSFLF